MKNFKFLFVLFIFVSHSFYSQTDVKVGIYLKSFIPNNDDTFYADLYWWTKVPTSIDYKLVDEYSKIEFTNLKESDQFSITEKSETKNFYYITGVCKGTFMYTSNYKDYPIDSHKIPIIIESVNLTNNIIRLIPDLDSYKNNKFQGFNENIKLDNFIILSSSFDKKTQIYNTNFGDPKLTKNSNYSQLDYNINIKRKSFSYLSKILIPCILLSLIAYLVFFIPADKLDVAVGCTVTSLLAAIAVQLSTATDIAHGGYLTISDKIFYLFYTLMCFALVQTVYSYNLDSNGKTKFSNQIEMSGRFAYPIILILGLLIILF